MKSIGKYDQRVKFLNFQDVDDGFGGTYPDWVTILETFARMIQVGSKSDIEQMQLGLNETFRIAIHKRASYRPTIKDLVEWRGSRYTIKSATETDLRQGKEYIIDIVREGDGG